MAMRRVKLMSHYSADFPLWDVRELRPDEVPLSEELVQQLREWQALFEREFHYDHGWSQASHRKAYCGWGRSLHARLQDELGPGWTVSLSLWPCEVGGGRGWGRLPRRRETLARLTT
jgi:hypothetical protein